MRSDARARLAAIDGLRRRSFCWQHPPKLTNRLFETCCRLHHSAPHFRKRSLEPLRRNSRAHAVIDLFEPDGRCGRDKNHTLHD
jgi:hypothetical protein